MVAICIAAAQSVCHPGDVAANVREHTRFITAAHEAGVQLLVFPELSLCGYELPLLQSCVLHANHDALAPLRKLVLQTGMAVMVGAPLANGTHLPAIGAITFLPDGSSTEYRKQHLHPGEGCYASPGPAGSRIHALHGQSLAQAICADTSHAQHPTQAAAAGATLYVAGMLVSEAGYPTDAGAMQHYARTLAMGVLMANHGGPSGGYVSAGKSAFWAPGGELVVAAPGTGSGLLIASRKAGTDPSPWRGSWVGLQR